MKTKFYWHIHHDILVEPLIEPIRNRIEFIKDNKPKKEVALRLNLLKPVKGKLPKDIIKAKEAYVKAGKAYDKAGKAYDKAEGACDKAREAYDKAEKACDKALEKHKKEIEILHKKECPNCPWKGKSIFDYK